MLNSITGMVYVAYWMQLEVTSMSVMFMGLSVIFVILLVPHSWVLSLLNSDAWRWQKSINQSLTLGLFITTTVAHTESQIA